ncbi:hypothetical protein CSUNSWCD_1683 [Campylobacter showae CSUNSWCD]|uniref:Uncharacterized protein n=1 Tax=Campylobacter showae CSUNSWCD TaxID=1244083 RepID=M5IKR9_9BACT|nr:hypothetical protein CSUNSWCD_1683 [Campylobacter showae CSUNSWCD]
MRVKFEAKFDTPRSSTVQDVRGLLANLIKIIAKQRAVKYDKNSISARKTKSNIKPKIAAISRTAK